MFAIIGDVFSNIASILDTYHDAIIALSAISGACIWWMRFIVGAFDRKITSAVETFMEHSDRNYNKLVSQFTDLKDYCRVQYQNLFKTIESNKEVAIERDKAVNKRVDSLEERYNNLISQLLKRDI